MMCATVRAAALAAMISAALGVLAVPASAAVSIRDAETEHLLRTYADPVIRTAGLDPKAVRLHVIKSHVPNAFVAGGQNIFLHSGLITQTEGPDALIGVIAHELGHIAGGHLSRTREAYDSTHTPVLLSTLIGIGAIVAGAADAGAAVIASGQTVGARNLLRYSRIQESAADQAAVTFMDRAQLSSRGLLEVLETFADREVLSPNRSSPYAQSHPVSRDRIVALRSRVEQSAYKDRPPAPDLAAAHEMVKAKLQGFIDPPQVTLRRFPASNDSPPARYARAIAFFREAEVDKAVAELDRLLAVQMDNPYIHELKGQILFESGYPGRALQPYREAVRLGPDEPLIRTGLAQVMLSTGDPVLTREAMGQLETAIAGENDNPFTWFQLALAHGRSGDIGMAELATAERYLAGSDAGQALYHAMRAMEILPGSSAGWQRAQDISKAAAAAEGRP